MPYWLMESEPGEERVVVRDRRAGKSSAACVQQTCDRKDSEHDRRGVGASARGLGDEQAIAGPFVAGDGHRDQEGAGIVGEHGGARAGAVGPQQRDGRVGRKSIFAERRNSH